MNFLTFLCVTICTLILSTLTLFLVVYINELKREKELRKEIYDANKNLSPLMTLIPISMPSKSNIEQPKQNLNKKNFN